MARKPKAQPSAAKSLQEALKFCAPAYKAIGAVFCTHIVIHNKFVYSFDGVMAAGCPIEDEITGCPQATKLAAALNRSGTGLQISQTPDGLSFHVKLGPFKATVPGVAFADIAPFGPDPNIAPIDDRLKAAFDAIMHLASDNAPRMICASLLLRANTVISTNAAVLMEFHHGINLPPDLVIPKVFAATVAKCEKTLTGFGFSEKSVTFYFEDGSWYKTQRYADKWPSTEEIFQKQIQQNVVAVPTGFFEGVAALAPFAGDVKTVQSSEGLLYAGAVGTPDASYVVKGLPAGLCLGTIAVGTVAGRVDRVSWGDDGDPVYFYSDTLRVAVSRVMPDNPDVKPSGEAVTPNAIQVPVNPEPVDEVQALNYQGF